MEIKEERLDKELAKSNIPLVLNEYNDIFSDFDPRPFTQRALSDDFLLECKRAARDKELGFELILSMPKNKRKPSDESKILKRLKEHFKKHHAEEERNIRKIKGQGIKWMIFGFAAVIIAIIIRASKESTLLDSIIEPLLVIPGWFSIWEGLTRIFIKSKEAAPNQQFYEKMASADISFRSY